MSAGPLPTSPFAAPDPRPLVVTLVVVGYLLICALGGLNALVVLVNGSTTVVLVESPSHDPFANIEAGGEYDEFLPEPRKPELIEAERIGAVVFIGVALTGLYGAICLFNRKVWSRGVLWATTGAAIVSHALYSLRVLQIQSADIVSVLEKEHVFQLAATTSMINVAIQSIPLIVLAGLLRHSALRSYILGTPDESLPVQ